MSDSYDLVIKDAAREYVNLRRQFLAARVYARLISPESSVSAGEIEWRDGVFRVLGFLTAHAISMAAVGESARCWESKHLPFTMDVTVRQLLDAWVSFFYPECSGKEEEKWQGTYVTLLRHGLFPRQKTPSKEREGGDELVVNMSLCTLSAKMLPFACAEQFNKAHGQYRLSADKGDVERAASLYRLRFLYRRDNVPPEAHFFCFFEAHALFLYLGEILFTLSFEKWRQSIKSGGGPSFLGLDFIKDDDESPAWQKKAAFFVDYADYRAVDMETHGFFSVELLDYPLSTLLQYHILLLTSLDKDVLDFFGFSFAKGGFQSAWSSWSLACRQEWGLITKTQGGPLHVQNFYFASKVFLATFFERQRRVFAEINMKLERIVHVFRENESPVSAKRVLESCFSFNSFLYAMDVCSRGSLENFSRSNIALRALVSRLDEKEAILLKNLATFNASVHDFALNSPELAQNLKACSDGKVPSCGVNGSSSEVLHQVARLLEKYVEVITAATDNQENFVALVARVNEHQEIALVTLKAKWSAMIETWIKMWRSRQEQFFVESLSAVVKVKSMNIRCLEFCIERFRFFFNAAPSCLQACPQSLLLLEQLDKVGQDLQQLREGQRVACLEKLCATITEEIQTDINSLCFNEFLRCRLQDIIFRCFQVKGSSPPAYVPLQPSNFLFLFLHVAREQICSANGTSSTNASQIDQALRAAADTHSASRYGQVAALQNIAAVASQRKHQIFCIKLNHLVDIFLEDSNFDLHFNSDSLPIHRYFLDMHRFSTFCKYSVQSGVSFASTAIFTPQNLRAFKRALSASNSEKKKSLLHRKKLFFKLNEVNKFNMLMIDIHRNEECKLKNQQARSTAPCEDGPQIYEKNYFQNTKDICCKHIYKTLLFLTP